MATVMINRGALTAMLRGPQGPVARMLAAKALQVTNQAKQGCPVDTGRLRSSIRWSLGQDGIGLFALVGTDVNYAIYVHNGTRYMAARPFLLDAMRAVGVSI